MREKNEEDARHQVQYGDRPIEVDAALNNNQHAYKRRQATRIGRKQQVEEAQNLLAAVVFSRLQQSTAKLGSPQPQGSDHWQIGSEFANRDCKRRAQIIN